ncbi:hypothetical protein [Humibacter sp.]|uniref:hypothetical protein n=1 Tax=Humibacter sp. TaxID=1940291 RepID=UPI003F7F998F
MRRVDRLAAARLEATMDRHAAREKQTLYELRRAGFEFQTVDDAKRWLRAQRKFPGFTQEQINIAIRAMSKEEQK